MFSPLSNENLIKENAAGIADNVLYSFGDAENKSIYNSLKPENKKSAFANFANIAGNDEIPTFGVTTVDNVINNYYKSPEFKGVSLYKPLGVANDNRFGKNVYNYSLSSATAVKGMAFAGSNGGNLNNPLAKPYNIVDNSYEFNRTITNSDFTDVINATKIEKTIEATRVEIAPVARNTFKMADILVETEASQIISFKPRQEVALTKVTKMSAFLAKQRNMIENLKNMFIVKKEKVK